MINASTSVCVRGTFAQLMLERELHEIKVPILTTGLLEMFRILRFSRNVRGETSNTLFVEMFKTSTDEANESVEISVYADCTAVRFTIFIDASGEKSEIVVLLQSSVVRVSIPEISDKEVTNVPSIFKVVNTLKFESTDKY